jgi:hypothetical protein
VLSLTLVTAAVGITHLCYTFIAAETDSTLTNALVRALDTVRDLVGRRVAVASLSVSQLATAQALHHDVAPLTIEAAATQLLSLSEYAHMISSVNAKSTVMVASPNHPDGSTLCGPVDFSLFPGIFDSTFSPSELALDDAATACISPHSIFHLTATAGHIASQTAYLPDSHALSEAIRGLDQGSATLASLGTLSALPVSIQSSARFANLFSHALLLAAICVPTFLGMLLCLYLHTRRSIRLIADIRIYSLALWPNHLSMFSKVHN